MSFAERPIEDWQSRQPNPASAAVKPALETIAAETAVQTPATQLTAAVWGWLPVLSIVQAGGLLLISLANRGALVESPLSTMLFWLGLAVMLVPTAWRLIATDVSRQERIGLLISLGMMLYFVKLIQSPFGFTYSDEFLHLFNTGKIIETKSLFSQNLVLPVSPLFPGLPSVTAAIASVTGLSLFHAGAIVIGVARLLLVTALFLLAEQVSRSPRIAGLTTLFFMCNSNFLYWSAQFAYESLSFPLVIGALYLIARREQVERRSTYTAYTIMALLAVSAIVVTHHLSAYFMVAFLFGWWFLVRFELHHYLGHALNIVNQWRKGKLPSEALMENLGSRPTVVAALQTDASVVTATDRVNADGTEVPTERGPEGLALFAFILSLAWLTYVAITTYGYISLVLSKAGISLLDVLRGSDEFRQLFVGNDGYMVPVGERVVAMLGVLLSLVGLPIGLYHFWQRFRHRAVAWILATGAVSYFAMLPLRLTAASWETGNRASVYFSLGLAFTLALAADRIWANHQPIAAAILRQRAAFALIFTIIFAGGLVSGWDPQIRFTQPFLVSAGEEVVEPIGVSTAKKIRELIGSNQRIVSDETNGRLLLTYGEQTGYVGRYPYVYDILRSPTFTPVQYNVMQEWDLDYAVVDRRELAWDRMKGYFFNEVDAQGESTATWTDPAIYEKFDRQPLVSRMLDAGTVVVYDTGDLVATARRIVNGESLPPEVLKLLVVGDESGIDPNAVDVTQD